jgi:hypothetical protein
VTGCGCREHSLGGTGAEPPKPSAEADERAAWQLIKLHTPDGEVIPLGDPDPTRLARHVARYGDDEAEPWSHLLEDAPVIQKVIFRKSRTSRGRSQTRMATRRKSQKFSVTR